MTGHWRTLETEDGTLHIDLREVVAIYGEPTSNHVAVYLRGGVELVGIVGDADTLRDALLVAQGSVACTSCGADAVLISARECSMCGEWHEEKVTIT